MNICDFQLLGRFSTPILSSLAHALTYSFQLVEDVAVYTFVKHCVNSVLHTCSVAICPHPPEIDHGSVNITGNCIGDYAHYTCDPGFKLTGDPYLICEKLDIYTAAFQPNPPVCHRECCMNIADWLHAFLRESYQNSENYRHSTLLFMLHWLTGWKSMVLRQFTILP